MGHGHHLSIANEPKRRPPPRAVLAALALLLACALVACGAPGGGGSGSDSSTSDQSTSEPAPEPEPTTEDPDPTTPASSSSNANPAISVARLPVGGGSENVNDTATLQCANVSWIVDPDGKGEIPGGTAVEITKVLFFSPGFSAVRDGCGSGVPNCIGYLFRSTAQRCDLLVRVPSPLPQDATLSVGFAGLVYCPRNDSDSCR